MTRPVELVRPITMVKTEVENVSEVLLWQGLRDRLGKISAELGNRSLMGTPNNFDTSDVFSKDIDASNRLPQGLLKDKDIESLGLNSQNWAEKYIIKSSEEDSSEKQEILIICRPNTWSKKNHRFFAIGDFLNQVWTEEIIRAYIIKMEKLLGLPVKY